MSRELEICSESGTMRACSNRDARERFQIAESSHLSQTGNYLVHNTVQKPADHRVQRGLDDK